MKFGNAVEVEARGRDSTATVSYHDNKEVVHSHLQQSEIVNVQYAMPSFRRIYRAIPRKLQAREVSLIAPNVLF